MSEIAIFLVAELPAFIAVNIDANENGASRRCWPRRRIQEELGQLNPRLAASSPRRSVQHQLPITPNENWRLIARKGSVPKIVMRGGRRVLTYTKVVWLTLGACGMLLLQSISNIGRRPCISSQQHII